MFRRSPALSSSAPSEPAIARAGNCQPVPPEEHGNAQHRYYKKCIRAKTGESAAVVVACRRKSIEHFAEAVGAGIKYAAFPAGGGDGDGGAEQDKQPPGISTISEAIFIS